MPLLLLLGIGGLGTGFILGSKTSQIIQTVIIAGVVYYIFVGRKK